MQYINEMKGYTMENLIKTIKYRSFHMSEIHPKGWLYKQLEIQAKGLCGNLDRFWPDIKDSRWIGGAHEGWERVPYWLDGFIPLAFLLNNDNMKQRARIYINAILDRQQKDGWLCPCSFEERTHYDVWPLFLILKVLVIYDDATGDPRIESAVYRALKNLERHIDFQTLNNWAQMRWFECLIPIYWLYEKRPEKWLFDLCIKIKSQGFDYQTFFKQFPYKQPVPKDMWSLMSHGVNLAMALKSPALEYLISGEESDLMWADYMLEQLENYHGMVTGMFSADECLSGKSPIQGTELCAVTEMMYSLEILLAVSGNGKYGDLLEKITFNALPATLSPDMWSHQYDQQVNQINCVETKDPIFNTNRGDSNLFGLEPHFGCCTVNFSQGWPKFVLSTILKGEDDIFIVSYAPVKINTMIQGTAVMVEVTGEYPFCEKVSINIECESEIEFSVRLRIPDYAQRTKIRCGESFVADSGTVFTLDRKWAKKNLIEIDFPMQPVLENRPNNMVAVKYGPLIFSLKLEEEWKRVHQNEKGKEFPHCDYEVRTKSEWRYGIFGSMIKVSKNAIGEYPFCPENAPIELSVPCAQIEWKENNTYASRLPICRKPISAICNKTFIPYGCTNIRLTELPLLDLQTGGD